MTNTLKQNLELRKALAEVDRLTSENVSLDYINSQQDIIIKDLKDDVKMLRSKLAKVRKSLGDELNKNN